jgi:hypothetical protein
MSGRSKDFKNKIFSKLGEKHDIPRGCYKNHQWICNSYESIINTSKNMF